MNLQLRIAALAILSSAATCNYTDGDCWPVGQSGGNGSVGSGVIDSTGSGPSGDAPQGQAPSFLSGSACNAPAKSSPGGGAGSSGEGNTSGSGAGGATQQIEPPSPCEGKCLAAYEDASAVCGKIAEDAQRKACQDIAYEIYQSCRVPCLSAQKTCLDMYEDCTDRKYAPCNKIINHKRLCAYCQDDCEAGKPYNYKQCQQCGFQ